jgi:hypothetical protein
LAESLKQFVKSNTNANKMKIAAKNIVKDM